MMKEILRRSPWLLATLLLVVAWVVVIAAAVHVSGIVLGTLDAIVDLANLTP